MKGDFSRLSFDPKKHFSGVRLQQGRVQLDSDWNEQLDINMHRLEAEITDFVGPSGVPADAADRSTSFEIGAQGDTLTIGPGRCYIKGKLFENEQQIDFTAQPDFPSATLPKTAGRYLVYLDAWQRHITALEDGDIRETALGGPDTSTRIKNVWQVRICDVPKTTAPADLISAAKLSAFFNEKFTQSRTPTYLPLSTGSLSARLQSVGVTLENQLYRVEIHQGGSPQEATFKWSRDNGAVAARVNMVAGRTITIDTSGGMPFLNFAPGQWIELSTQDQALQGEPGVMVRLQSVEGNALTVEQWPGGGTTAPAVSAGGRYSIVRRWDSPNGPQPLTAGTSGWILLEDEIEVQFALDADLFYRSGDYWLIPARYLAGNINWPRNPDGSPAIQPPLGIQHQYTALALLDLNAKGQWQAIPNGDLRTRFKPITVGLLSKAGDTVEGKLRIVEDLQVDKTLYGSPDNPEGLVIQGDVTVRGNLNVSGQSSEVLEQTMSGNITLGDGDTSVVTIEGEMATGHSSGKLQIRAPMHLNAPLTVAGITLGDGNAAAALDIQGNGQLPLRVQSTHAGGTRLAIENSSENGRAWELISTGASHKAGAGHLLFEPGNVLIARTGNVGIGTTNPGNYKLNIGSTNGEQILHLASDFGLYGDDKLNLIRFGNEGEYQFLHKASGAFSRNTLALHVNQNDAFGVYSSGWTSLLEVKGGSGDLYVRGNVGIGTAEPTVPLDIRGDATTLKLQAKTAKNATYARFQDSTGTVQGLIGVDGLGFSGTENQFNLATWSEHPIKLFTNGAERLAVAADGNVSIGTANPGGFKLRVDGDLYANKIVVQNGVDGGNTRGIWMWAPNTSNWGIYMGQSGAGKSLAGGTATAGAGFTSHAIRLRTYNHQNNGLIYENSQEQLNFSVRASDGKTYLRGNTSIGTTDPGGFKLRVDGDLYANKIVVQNGVDGGNTRGLWMWTPTDSNWGIYMGQSGAGRSLAGGTATAGAGFTTYAIRIRTANHTGHGLIYENNQEQLNFSVRASDGQTYVRGNLQAGNSDLYFTKTDHNHSMLGNTTGHAAIENAADYNALMILGRAGTPNGRAVRLWDWLEVNGQLHVQGTLLKKLDLIACQNRGDWGSSNHPIMVYFRNKLSGKPVGTMVRAIQDHPSWRGHFWDGWVAADGTIRVMHNHNNTGHTA